MQSDEEKAHREALRKSFDLRPAQQESKRESRVARETREICDRHPQKLYLWPRGNKGTVPDRIRLNKAVEIISVSATIEGLVTAMARAEGSVTVPGKKAVPMNFAGRPVMRYLGGVIVEAVEAAEEGEATEAA